MVVKKLRRANAEPVAVGSSHSRGKWCQGEMVSGTILLSGKHDAEPRADWKWFLTPIHLFMCAICTLPMGRTAESRKQRLCAPLLGGGLGLQRRYIPQPMAGVSHTQGPEDPARC